MSYDDFIKYYILSMHALIMFRIFLAGLTAYACFAAVRAILQHDGDNHPLEKIRTALFGLGIFHFLIAALGIFILIVDDFETPDYIHAIQTAVWSLGIVITSVVTIRLCLFLMGVSNGKKIVPESPSSQEQPQPVTVQIDP